MRSHPFSNIPAQGCLTSLGFGFFPFLSFPLFLVFFFGGGGGGGGGREIAGSKWRPPLMSEDRDGVDGRRAAPAGAQRGSLQDLGGAGRR